MSERLGALAAAAVAAAAAAVAPSAVLHFVSSPICSKYWRNNCIVRLGKRTVKLGVLTPA